MKVSSYTSLFIIIKFGRLLLKFIYFNSIPMYFLFVFLFGLLLLSWRSLQIQSLLIKNHGCLKQLQLKCHPQNMPFVYDTLLLNFVVGLLQFFEIDIYHDVLIFINFTSLKIFLILN